MIAKEDVKAIKLIAIFIFVIIWGLMTLLYYLDIVGVR